MSGEDRIRDGPRPDGGGSADSSGSVGGDADDVSAGPESVADVLREAIARAFGGHDLAIVLATLASIYGLFTLFVLVANDFELTTNTINAIASTLRLLTFFAASYAVLALALNLHWGYTGLFNIGVAGFMAVGVYTMGLLSTPPDATSGMGLGLPLPVGVLGGMIAAGLVGLIAALPALRLEADYLAIVTLGLSEIIRLTMNSSQLSSWTVSTFGFGTGGGSGLNLPARPTDALFDGGAGEALLTVLTGAGIRRSIVVDAAYTLVVVAFVVGVYWLLSRVGASPFGRVLKAIRDDELVAQSLGKDTRLFKIKVFIVGCALMGLGGILWQGSYGYVNPNSFRPIVTFYVFVAVIIGGSGSNTGSIVGAILFVGLLFEGPRQFGGIVQNAMDLGSAPATFAGAVGPLFGLDPIPFLAYALENISALQFVLLGVVLIVIMQRRPEGVLGHRTETAAAIDLGVRPEGNAPAARSGEEPTSRPDTTAAADHGGETGGDGDE
ncbi:amino acid/amide ABC transporter membrane protein 2, HAAT family [Halopenitus malekzadehii]|uniref:Amino acid/amide ABC transporter membrane protein 2, HAAT family n=1 Tax=Halopenitus malekzadehii TaxID=1267564 RepID=A0A1H6IFT8_9EURY|nr:branched-chain amino acid ABC transporter permease [Halopenitus malekzadehii]SEH47735.1 amino acid/amide ABC transporter membrane protein 2, HAAT family [Halopenitus malekzadehii]